MLQIVTVCVCVLAVVYGYPGGPPIDVCGSMYPTGHNANSQTGTPHFTITLDKTAYTTSGTVQVTMTATRNYYEGVFLQARSTDCNNTAPIGSFAITQGDTFLKTMNCNSMTNSAVAQKVKEHITAKTVTWTAPSASVGQVYFRGTFIKSEGTFWTDIFSPVMQAPGESAALMSHCAVQTTMSSGQRINLSIWAVMCLSLLAFKLR